MDSAQPITQPKTILVVDDDRFARITVEALLTPTGHDIKFATSGIEMLETIDTIAPDVILLDVMMPRMSGYEACAKLKANPETKHIPVVLLTALADTESVVQGLEAGADEFLTKPVNGSELRARVRSMLRIKGQYDELQAMVALRDDLAYMTVHDLRTPLTTVSLYADLVSRHSDKPDRVSEYAGILQTQVQRLQQLVNEILMTAKIEEGQITLSRAELNSAEFVNTLATDHGRTATLKDVTLALEVDEALPNLAVDPPLLRRVFDNLLSNALKFTLRNSTVTLSARRGVCSQTGVPAVQFCVADMGPGVSAEFREHIFDKFAIVEMHKQNVSQLGLGLAFCKLVVDAHNGCIYVEDNAPSGARFVVEIPI